jgi:hypothetical protein
MDGWVTFQTWRQHSEDLRREAETRRLARTLRKGSPGRSRWFPVPWWELRRTAGAFSSPSEEEAQSVGTIRDVGRTK